MRHALKTVVILLGLVFLAMGLRYLIDPAGMGEQFGVQPKGATGFATLRADMFALFGVCGGAALLGGWRNDRKLLLVAVAICLFALTGRFVSFLVEGMSAGMVQAVTGEAIAVLVLFTASRVLPVKPDEQR